MSTQSENKSPFTYNAGDTVQRPRGRAIPHSGFGDNALWISMLAREVIHQTTLNRGGGIGLGKYGPIFKFIAPDTIAETIKNDWSPYETSMVNNLANKAKTVHKTVSEISDIKRNLQKNSTGLNEIQGKLDKKGALGAYNSISNALTVNIQKARIDSPLVYTGSDRRVYDFIFNLVAYDDPYEDVVAPVKDLMKYSSPEMDLNNVIGITLPWVFTIKSEPENLINVQFAALTAVQPSWLYPFINGYPTKCELTLSFTDVSPLYRSTIAKGGIITVVD